MRCDIAFSEFMSLCRVPWVSWHWGFGLRYCRIWRRVICFTSTKIHCAPF